MWYLTRRIVEGNLEGLTRKELVEAGVYGIVRHPMHLAGIIIFTFNPNITADGLLITVIADLYFLFGMFIEELRPQNIGRSVPELYEMCAKTHSKVTYR